MGRCGAMTSYCPMNMRYCSHPAQRGLGHCVSEPVSCEGKRRKKRGKAQPLLLATLGARPANRAPGKLVLLCVSPFFLSALLTFSQSIFGLVGIVWRRSLHHVAAVFFAWRLLSLAGLGATSGWPGSATSEYSRRHRAPRPADCRPSMGQVLVPLQYLEYPAAGCCGTTPDRTPG
ncbi:hypothetical protein V8C40DRAFT_122173 [Trichoderma camerunense]